MRFAIHISPEDPLPAPTGIVDLPGFPASASSIGYAFVPNWLVPNEPLNTSVRRRPSLLPSAY